MDEEYEDYWESPAEPYRLHLIDFAVIASTFAINVCDAAMEALCGARWFLMRHANWKAQQEDRRAMAATVLAEIEEL